MKMQITGFEPAIDEKGELEFVTIHLAASLTKDQFRQFLKTQKQWGIDVDLKKSK